MVPKSRSRWQTVRKPLVVAACIVLFAGILVLITFGYRLSWTGFSTKTLWDWLALLIIPVVLSIAGFWLSQIQQRREDRITQGQKEIEQAIATDNQREGLLQAYIDKMSELLVEERERKSTSESEVKWEIARVRTLTVLPRLDGLRKRSVLQFLYESGLIDKKGKQIINVSEANLRGADLSEANLHGADLQYADLSEANLFSADLRETDLSGADLHGANLREANLEGGHLCGAFLWSSDLKRARLSGIDLSGAWLERASLSKVNLSRSNLFEANLNIANLYLADLTRADLHAASFQHANLQYANLRGADLRGANLTDANLNIANLSGADLGGANLIRANLSDANLSGANLTDADLRYADLRGANLTDADLRYADLHGAKLEANLEAYLKEGARLEGVKLEGADSEGVGSGAVSRSDSFDKRSPSDLDTSRRKERYLDGENYIRYDPDEQIVKIIRPSKILILRLIFPLLLLLAAFHIHVVFLLWVSIAILVLSSISEIAKHFNHKVILTNKRFIEIKYKFLFFIDYINSIEHTQINETHVLIPNFLARALDIGEVMLDKNDPTPATRTPPVRDPFSLEREFNLQRNRNNWIKNRREKKEGTAPLTSEHAQATLRGRPRGRLSRVESGKGCVRGRPRGRLGTVGSASVVLRGRPRRFGSTQGAGATLKRSNSATLQM